MITIFDFDLLRSGLHIAYNEASIDLDPQGTCELFKQAGLIADYKNYDGDLIVKETFEWNGKEKTIWLEYAEYVMDFRLTEMTAEHLVTTYTKLLTIKKAA